MSRRKTANKDKAGSQPGLWRRLTAWARPSDRGTAALRQAEQQALRAETRLREAINALPEGLVFLDSQGRYVLWNERYAEIYHRSADLFREGVRLADTLKIGVARGDYPEAIGREDEWLAARMALLDNPGERHEQQLADGRWVMIEERRTSEGGTIGLRVDITEMKEQAAALTMALHRAEAASRSKSEFLANMSHEIRTPLNGVLGLAEVLDRTDLDDKQRDLLKTIIGSAATLDGILGDLLDFSRLDAGRLTMAETAFDLGALIEQAAAPFRNAAQAKALSFELALDETARRRVVGDQTRLRQILTNLLSNAVKFTSAGRVGFTVARAARGDRYYFEVRDSGIGFEPEQAERLFSRFEQADGSITRQFGGSGLGLSISRQLAELMGGQVSAAGKPGRGAVFTVMLPLVEARDAPAAVEAAVERSDRPLRILVVDDNETNRKVAELILAAIGAEVICVEDGKAAVEAVESRDLDLVLMDLQMPVMDGLSATRAIRASEADRGLPRLPIVVLSANVMREHVEASKAAGADNHIGKPVRAEALIAAVLQAVDGERKAVAA